MTILEILTLLKETPSTIDKKNIIKKNNSDLLELIFRDTYNTSVKYNVKKYEVVDKVSESLELFGPHLQYYHIDNNYRVFHGALEELASRRLTGNAACERIGEVIGYFDPSERWILDGVLQRNLKVGVSLDNYNDAVGKKSIDKYEVALADKFFDLKPEKQNEVVCGGKYLASRKLDGCVDYYCNVEFEDGRILPIGEVVKNKIKGNIKSFDGTSVVYKPILNWFEGAEDIDKSQKQWYEIETFDGKILKITGNDRLMTKNGWKRVDELSNEDEIMI